MFKHLSECLKHGTHMAHSTHNTQNKMTQTTQWTDMISLPHPPPALPAAVETVGMGTGRELCSLQITGQADLSLSGYN